MTKHSQFESCGTPMRKRIRCDNTHFSDIDRPGTGILFTSKKTPDIRSRNIRETEDYLGFVSKLIYPQTSLTKYGQFSKTEDLPITQISLLGILLSPIRKPTVLEKWSPYEIGLFEGALALFGKDFHQVQKWVKTKETKEIVEFYYVWKKTSHYIQWKRSFSRYKVNVPDDGGEEESVVDDDIDEVVSVESP
mmetsp:Transcript_22910/g.29734  ORF Transcript_22910/g.29734 Transcript_22910/m.29734 type:complete len:192 (+) Transcript_22910:31-606(+)